MFIKVLCWTVVRASQTIDVLLSPRDLLRGFYVDSIGRRWVCWQAENVLRNQNRMVIK